MSCFYVTSNEDDYKQIPSRVSRMTASGRKQTFVNVRKRPFPDLRSTKAPMSGLEDLPDQRPEGDEGVRSYSRNMVSP